MGTTRLFQDGMCVVQITSPPHRPHPSSLTPHPSSLIPHPSPLIPHPSPLTPHPSSLIPHPSSLIPHPSSLIPHPSPLIPHPSSLTPHPSSLTPHPSSLTPHPSSLPHSHPTSIKQPWLFVLLLETLMPLLLPYSAADSFSRDASVQRPGEGQEIHQPPGRRNQSLPADARPQPDRLVSLGAGSVREGPQGRQARVPVDRLQFLLLVPCHGARIVQQ